MHAMTLYQPWASLVVAGAKLYEFRRAAPPKALRGQRIAIHAADRRPRREEIQELLVLLNTRGGYGCTLRLNIAIPLLERWLTAPALLPVMSIVGTAELGAPVRLAALEDGPAPALTADNTWAWPLLDVGPFAKPILWPGQGIWIWPGLRRSAP